MQIEGRKQQVSFIAHRRSRNCQRLRATRSRSSNQMVWAICRYDAYAIDLLGLSLRAAGSGSNQPPPLGMRVDFLLPGDTQRRDDERSVECQGAWRPLIPEPPPFAMLVDLAHTADLGVQGKG